MLNGDDLRGRFRTDYTGGSTNRPALPDSPAPVIPPTNQREEKAPEEAINNRTENFKRKKSKKWLLFIAVLIIVSVSSAAGYYLFVKTPGDPFSAQTKQSFDYSLFYPTVLPAGYDLDHKSIKQSGQILTYQASNNDGESIIFTIQERPPTFDYSTFYKVALTGTEQFNTPLGQGAVGKSNDGYLGNLVTDNTWLLVRSDSKSINGSQLKQILEGLEKAS